MAGQDPDSLERKKSAKGKRGVAETEIAIPVIAWLVAEGWDVYQEVQIFTYADVADIVAVRHGLSWVVEVKSSLSLEVIAQAEAWKGYANYVSVAAFKRIDWQVSRSPGKGRELARRVLDWLGIGLFTVSNRQFWDEGAGKISDALSAEYRINPRLNRRLVRNIAGSLKPEHKTFARAGNTEGLRYTPFAATCAALADIVKSDPGISLRDAIKIMGRSHYASEATARSSLRHWISEGKIKGVTFKKDGKFIRLYPTGP
jgi:hypothetical protein